MNYFVFFLLLWLLFAILSVFMTIWNYMTKCDIECGDYVRVYSIGGFFLRLVMSLFPPPVNILCLGIVFNEPLDNKWLDAKTKEDCRRVKFDRKLNERKPI